MKSLPGTHEYQNVPIVFGLPAASVNVRLYWYVVGETCDEEIVADAVGGVPDAAAIPGTAVAATAAAAFIQLIVMARLLCCIPLKHRE
jgi:hypothetical protein